MPELAKPPRRRWYQFGLGTLLLLITVVALLVFAIREHGQRIRQETQFAEREAQWKQYAAEQKGMLDLAKETIQVQEDRLQAESEERRRPAASAGSR